MNIVTQAMEVDMYDVVIAYGGDEFSVGSIHSIRKLSMEFQSGIVRMLADLVDEAEYADGQTINLTISVK